MNVRNFECRSYKRAMELLGGKDRRVVCNNTFLGICAMGVGVVFHGHTIVRLQSDGEVVLDACGYRTVTMKNRINRCLPGGWRVAQAGGIGS